MDMAKICRNCGTLFKILRCKTEQVGLCLVQTALRLIDGFQTGVQMQDFLFFLNRGVTQQPRQQAFHLGEF